MKPTFFKVSMIVLSLMWSSTGCNKENAVTTVLNPTSLQEVKPTIQKMLQLNDKSIIIPNQYVILFDEKILPPFLTSSESKHSFTDRAQTKKAAEVYKQKMVIQIQKIAQEQLGITSTMIKTTFSAATTGIVVQLNEDQVKEIINKLSKIEVVAAMSPDFEIQLDEVKTPPQTVINSISKSKSKMEQFRSWGIDVVGSSDYTGNNWAWILDTGIEEHSDLNVGTNEGANFTTSPYGVDDWNGHGTKVAGIIGAKNNNIGVIGVAAGARVIPVKVLGDDAKSRFSWMAQGLDHVASSVWAGDVVNMSISLSAFSNINTRDQMEEGIRNLASRGVKIVCSAGNYGMHASTRSPARMDGRNIYTISAMDTYRKLVHESSSGWASNYGNGPVDFAAPGVWIYSTDIYNEYNYLSGTSASAAFVSGILLVNGYVGNGGTLEWDMDETPDIIAIL